MHTHIYIYIHIIYIYIYIYIYWASQPFFFKNPNIVGPWQRCSNNLTNSGVRRPVADKYSSTWDVASPIRTTYIYAEIRMLFLSTGRRQMYCPFLNVKFS